MDIDHEISLLVACLKRIGTQGDDGNIHVPFGAIFKDEVSAPRKSIPDFFAHPRHFFARVAARAHTSHSFELTTSRDQTQMHGVRERER